MAVGSGQPVRSLEIPLCLWATQPPPLLCALGSHGRHYTPTHPIPAADSCPESILLSHDFICFLFQAIYFPSSWFGFHMDLPFYQLLVSLVDARSPCPHFKPFNIPLPCLRQLFVSLLLSVLVSICICAYLCYYLSFNLSSSSLSPNHICSRDCWCPATSWHTLSPWVPTASLRNSLPKGFLWKSEPA